MRSIAVMNQKGGCGKTTTVVSLSGCLAIEGHRVLVVDVDTDLYFTNDDRRAASSGSADRLGQAHLFGRDESRASRASRARRVVRGQRPIVRAGQRRPDPFQRPSEVRARG